MMLTKEKYYTALNDMCDSTLLSKDDCEENRKILAQLIDEHFKIVEQLQDEVDKYKHEYYAMCDLVENP